MQSHRESRGSHESLSWSNATKSHDATHRSRTPPQNRSQVIQPYRRSCVGSSHTLVPKEFSGVRVVGMAGVQPCVSDTRGTPDAGEGLTCGGIDLLPTTTTTTPPAHAALHGHGYVHGYGHAETLHVPWDTAVTWPTPQHQIRTRKASALVMRDLTACICIIIVGLTRNDLKMDGEIYYYCILQRLGISNEVSKGRKKALKYLSNDIHLLYLFGEHDTIVLKVEENVRNQ